jgi:methionyl-tRNA synthetase
MPLIVTSALPYANGPIHIGHLVEYIQTDIYVRFLKSQGENVIYCCADDTHGTPIELNASQLGISPEKLIEKYHKEHFDDFQKFLVNFDNFYTTNSQENKEFSDFFFTTLKNKGDIYKKNVELTYCETCSRFLPDRYVKGICPKCGSEEQYGDNCEKCNATYEPTELINAKCVICSNEPVRKTSEHYFFALSKYADKLKSWLENNDNLQNEVKNYVLNWIKEGLKDWDITRDAPYFGFKIAGEEDKYYYVWLDAPIGYIASCKNYCDKRGLNYEAFWKSESGRIIHFIGKDIIYFHFLFWPAMLMGVGFNLPENIVVHGFLTVNNQKMSKSRGTFITAQECAKKLNPEYLRYYYANILGHSLKDINLDVNDLKNRINSELIDNFGNLANRSMTFLYKNFDGKLSNFSFPEKEKEILKHANEAIRHYNEFNYHLAIKSILDIGFIANKFFQDSAPWSLIKENREKAAKVLSFSVNVVKIMGALLKPVIPGIIGKLEKILNIEDLKIKAHLNFELKEHTISKPKLLFKKIEELSLFDSPPASKILLKTGEIVEVLSHPDADKLYILKVKFGDEIRQIVSGIKDYYSISDLIGKVAVFVYNLKKAKIRGVESNGMILAAKKETNLGIILTDTHGGAVVQIENVEYNNTKEISVKDFAKLDFFSDGNNVFCNNCKLLVDNGKIYPDKKISGEVG